MSKEITPLDIDSLQTINSMYGDGKLNVYIGDDMYRIEVTELLKMLKPDLRLEVTMKRKYNYLTVREDV